LSQQEKHDSSHKNDNAFGLCDLASEIYIGRHGGAKFSENSWCYDRKRQVVLASRELSQKHNIHMSLHILPER